MLETPDDLAALQVLLDESRQRSTGHLRSIVSPDRTLSARQVANALTGMRVLVVATTTARGEPRTSAVDGHFLRGRWIFGTSGTAAKARQLRARPAVSVSYVDGERLGVFAHGVVEEIGPDHADFGWIDAHLTEHYGSSPSTWEDDIPLFRVVPRWTVAYTSQPDDFPAD